MPGRAGATRRSLAGSVLGAIGQIVGMDTIWWPGWVADLDRGDGVRGHGSGAGDGGRPGGGLVDRDHPAACGRFGSVAVDDHDGAALPGWDAGGGQRDADPTLVVSTYTGCQFLFSHVGQPSTARSSVLRSAECGPRPLPMTARGDAGPSVPAPPDAPSRANGRVPGQ
jgi:hypothetical protein